MLTLAEAPARMECGLGALVPARGSPLPGCCAVYHPTDEAGVIPDRVEVPAASQHQDLIQRVLQPVVGRLGDAVFVGGIGIDQGGLEPVVVQKLGVAVVKGLAAGALNLPILKSNSAK